MTTSPFLMVKGDYWTALTPAGIIRCLQVHHPTPKVVNKPSPPFIVHGLDKPGGFTTVSFLSTQLRRYPPSIPTLKEPSGGGKNSHSRGSPSIKLACSSPNSASSRFATLRVSYRTVFTSRLRSSGKKSWSASRLSPEDTREDHLASIYSSSGATGSVNRADRGRSDDVLRRVQSQCSSRGL